MRWMEQQKVLEGRNGLMQKVRADFIWNAVIW